MDAGMTMDAGMVAGATGTMRARMATAGRIVVVSEVDTVAGDY